MADDNQVKSLARAMQVLECFSVEQPEMGPSEIAKMLGMQKSTVYNILSTFQRLGYLMKNPDTGKYCLGMKVLHLGYIVNSHHGMRDLFLPYLTRIAQETREVCYFGILNENEVLYIESTYPSSQQPTRNILGERAPLYCTGIGKAMLAYLPEGQIDAVIHGRLKAYTSFTMTDPAMLLHHLEEIRQNGYAVDNMEHEFGIRCVAVPVFNAAGKVFAAVSVSGPSPRFDPETLINDARIISGILEPLQRIV